MILSVDLEKEKIALGLKQKQPSPWDMVESKYPVGTRVHGEVVNVMTYGAFVRLEQGIEGLVHISEMSWTKRVNHPSELVQIGDQVDVVVLGINKEKQEISLGMKQTTPNPVGPGRREVSGRSRDRRDGAQPHQLRGLHRDRRGDRRPVARQRHVVDPQDFARQRNAAEGGQGQVPGAVGRSAAEAHRPGAQAACSRIRGPKRFPPSTIRARSSPGRSRSSPTSASSCSSKPNLEGLLHISELADHKVENPEQIVKVGDQIEVRILRVDTADRKIGLSRKLNAPIEEEGGEGSEGAGAVAAAPAAPREELKGGREGSERTVVHDGTDGTVIPPANLAGRGKRGKRRNLTARQS